jgi:hypothetical protein
MTAFVMRKGCGGYEFNIRDHPEVPIALFPPDA